MLNLSIVEYVNIQSYNTDLIRDNYDKIIHILVEHQFHFKNKYN